MINKFGVKAAPTHCGLPLVSMTSDLLAMTRDPHRWGPAAASGEEPLSPAAPLRVLVVEDDTLIAWTLQAILEEMGHEVVDLASSGERAVKAAAELKPHLILMDINLGAGITGIEAAERVLKEAQPEIIFVSAYGDPDTKARIDYVAPGAPLLSKPVDVELLERAISGLSRRKQ